MKLGTNSMTLFSISHSWTCQSALTVPEPSSALSDGTLGILYLKEVGVGMLSIANGPLYGLEGEPFGELLGGGADVLHVKDTVGACLGNIEVARALQRWNKSLKG